ncbi:MAG: sulfatase [Bacteroidetes bacterium]|nr:MAG: sulfatase [Bacteroidota bacterium]
MNKIALLVGIALVIGVAGCNKSQQPVQPNIILLISDDQSWPHYSFLEHEHIQTPRIDQLAAEGLTIINGYTTAPLCRPALASMATGLYPHQHKAIGNDPVFDPGGKEAYGKDWLAQRAVNNKSVVDGIQELSTIADLLAEAGYVSLQTGKWWEGHYSVGGFSQGMTHGDPSRGGRHGDKGLEIGRKGLDVIYDFMDEAHSSETPFFVWYAPFLPHAPHTPPDSLRDKYLPLAPTPAVANYWAMCEWFDITCGQLMDYIDEKELSENTLFVYVTDNGWIQDPDRPNRYAPRSKRAPYDMGIRTPIMYRWKGVIEPEMDKTSLSSSIDIATTILDVCGIEPTAEMQGINVLDRDARAAREAVFAEVYAHDFNTVDSSLYHRIIITRPWKLILTDPAYNPDRGPELYNLDTDPYEWENQAEAHPEIVTRLSAQLEEWWNQ